MKKWPFPGDAPITRVRKVGLAYRNLAEQQQDIIRVLADALKGTDRRLIAFDSPATLESIDLALKELDKMSDTPVADLDKRFRDWGETWHCPEPTTYDDDDLVPTKIAASMVHVTSTTISQLRSRKRITGVWNPDIGARGGWMYRVGDVYKLSTELRARNWRQKYSTDSVTDSGSSDTE